jgi:hypothetical protein
MENKLKRKPKPKPNSTRSFRRTTARNQTFTKYKFSVRSSLVNFSTPEYSEKNLNFDVYEILASTEVFDNLRKIYQQFRLKRVTFAATPRTVGGTDPPPIWIYLDTKSNNMINYASLQELQGARTIPTKHFSLTSFRTSGRQNDFNFWYDCQQYPEIDLSIRLHCDTYPTNITFWMFQLGYSLEFRGLVIQTTSNMKVEQIKEPIVYNKSQEKKENEKIHHCEAKSALLDNKTKSKSLKKEKKEDENKKKEKKKDKKDENKEFLKGYGDEDIDWNEYSENEEN